MEIITIYTDSYSASIFSLLIAILIAVLLITFGWVTTPGVSILSIAAAYVIVLAYALYIIFIFPKICRSNTDALKFSYCTDLLIGLIFAAGIILEYILLPVDNTLIGLYEYGSVFVICFISSAIFTYRNRIFKHTLLTALTSGIVGSLVWLIFLLFVFYLFRGTYRQELVFLAEGNYDDFIKSGMDDYNIFILEDFFGAVFFHLLLLPFISTLLGVFGSGIAKLLKKIFQR